MSVTREEIMAELAQLIEQELNVKADDLKPDDDLRENLNMASLDAINIFMGVEEKFDVEISYEDIESIRTVSDAVDYFEKLVNSPADA